MRLYYTDHYELPLPEGHKFPIRKYRMLRELLEPSGRFDLQPAPLASAEDAMLAHDAQYVRAFLEGTLDAKAIRRIGFPYSPFLVTRTMASLGGTLAAARHAMRHGIGGCLAGGTHHAFRSEGSGFCVFNDIAVAIRSLGRRAAVVDLDVHQGDGTASIFGRSGNGEGADTNVLTFSMHGAHNFPFRKQQSSIDVELPDGAEDIAYLEALASVLPRIWEFGPEVVFFQSGVDALATDKLGRLALTHSGLQARDAMVFEGVRRHGVPLVITLGGGYSEPIEATVRAHANTFLAAAEIE